MTEYVSTTGSERDNLYQQVSPTIHILAKLKILKN